MNINPLNVKITRGVINGQMYELLDYDSYSKQIDYISEISKIGIVENYKGKNIILPFRGKYGTQNINPGIYDAGPVDFIIYPDDNNISQFVPAKVVEITNTQDMKEILEREDIIARMDEPWITSPDNITHFAISEEDRPEMICLKTALNSKKIDIDKYSGRFGDNFPNDKRQLKNNSVTLNILKRFCDCMDMEAKLILKDKNPNVPNPIGTEIVVSLTDVCIEDDEN